MSWQTVMLEAFDGISPAVIHEAIQRERAQAQAKADEQARLVAEAKAAEAAAAERQQQLVAALDALTREAATNRAAATQAVAQAIASTAGSLLPSIGNQGFADEIAIATAELLTQSEIAKARLSVPADMHERVVAALANAAPDCEITVVSDAALPEGTAKLDWPSGGADFDMQALIGKAQTALARRLEAL